MAEMTCRLCEQPAMDEEGLCAEHAADADFEREQQQLATLSGRREKEASLRGERVGLLIARGAVADSTVTREEVIAYLDKLLASADRRLAKAESLRREMEGN